MAAMRFNVTREDTLDLFPAWSPDGKYIAFNSQRTGGMELFAVTPDGSQMTMITFTAPNETDPVWQP